MHSLPDLAYDFNALEPYVDGRTMEIHHGKHHAAYVGNLNKALEAAGGSFGDQSLEALLQNLAALPESQRSAVRNNGGGHYNHSLFWSVMKGGGSSRSAELEQAILEQFGSFEDFKKAFAQAGATRFGSGWAWLVTKGGKLKVFSTPNQDNPVMEGMGTPILGLDVWEHAYYLQYQNRRPEYIENWWNVVDWEEVSRRFSAAI